MSQDDRARTNDALSFGPFSLFARERRLERDGQPTKVGSRSLLHECQRWMETALASLDDADRGTRKEMNLRAALGVAAMFTRGNGPEIRTALVRGLELADAVEEPHEQLRLLGALNILLTRTGDWRDSLAVAERSEQIATKLTDDPAAQSFAAWMVGTSRHLLGDQVEAETRCRTALSPSPISRSTAMLYFGFDHRIRGVIPLAGDADSDEIVAAPDLDDTSNESWEGVAKRAATADEVTHEL
jgi:hypothetical protein